MQTTPLPVYPWLHVQVKFPGVLVHVALESQLLVVASAHSSISDTVKCMTCCVGVSIQILPSQVAPFPAYPWLHVQVKLPGMLVHIALESQLLVVPIHSSISDTVKS